MLNETPYKEDSSGSGCTRILNLSALHHTPVIMPPWGKKAPGTHRIGGWVGSRAELHAVGKRHLARGSLTLTIETTVCNV
jgi:hypothetical protein